jgi:2-isopropylmalate synthase
VRLEAVGAHPKRWHRGRDAALIENEDETGEHWITIRVSPNIIDASLQALMDSIVYKLAKPGAPA